MKFNLNMPEIIILIRDPRCSAKTIKTIEYYSDLIKQFEKSVNKTIERYENQLIKSIGTILKKTTKGNKDEKKMAKMAIKKLKEDALTNQFKVSKHFTIYFRDSFEDDEELTYHQMKIVNGVISLPKSNFPDLLQFINNKSIEIINKNDFTDTYNDFFSIENDIIIIIQQRIRSNIENCRSRKNIFDSICIECKYNMFSHFRNIDGLIRFLELYHTYAIKIENLTKEISRNSKKKLSREKLLELKTKHKQILDAFIN